MRTKLEVMIGVPTIKLEQFKLDIETLNTNFILFSDGFGNTVRLMLVLIVGCQTNLTTRKIIKMIAP